MNGRDGKEMVGEEPTEVLGPVEPEEWPVTELYRVPAEAPEPGTDETVVVADAPAAEPPLHRRIPAGGAGLAAAILLAILGIALGAWLVSRDSGEADAGATTVPAATTTAPTPTTTSVAASEGEVPEVVGLRLSSARALLLAEDFEIRVTRRSSDRPPGEVIEQRPAAGSRLEPGGAVALVVARASAPVVVRVDVPEVESLPVAEAAKAVRDAGLRPEILLVSSKAEAGTVVEQEPSAGTEAREGSLVVLSVARSEASEISRVDVPDVVGSTVDEARRALRAVGLRVSVARVRDDAPAGTVVSQTPDAASSVREGATVRLRVSTGPPSVTVPDVLGLDEFTARQELEAAGFTVRVSEASTADPANDGVVLEQSPIGGTSSNEGAVVTVVIGRYD